MSNIKAQYANINTLETNVLNINQSVTSVKWDPSKKHSDILMLNSTQTAKLNNNKAGTKAVLGNIAYTVGINTDTIRFNINQGKHLYIGLATADRDTSSVIIDTKAVGHLFVFATETTLTMSLSRTLISTGPDVYSSKLVYIIEGETITVDTSVYNGSVMYPWVANNDFDIGFSVGISKSTVLKTYVNANGDVVFSTVDAGGVSRPIIFETGTDSTIFDNLGFSGLPNINYDILESSTSAENGVSNFNLKIRVKHPSSSLSNPGISVSESGYLTTNGIETPVIESSTGALILRETGGQNVTIDTSGNINTPGFIDTLSISSNTLQAPAGAPGLSLLENSGAGIVIEDVTGNVLVSSSLSVGDGGDLTSSSVLASFATTTLDKGLVIPTVQNVEISTIPTIQQVTGMIVFSIDDNKFMGFKLGSWVALSI